MKTIQTPQQFIDSLSEGEFDALSTQCRENRVDHAYWGLTDKSDTYLRGVGAAITKRALEG
jgi:hypothetical protein